MTNINTSSKLGRQIVAFLASKSQSPPKDGAPHHMVYTCKFPPYEGEIEIRVVWDGDQWYTDTVTVNAVKDTA